MTSGKHTDLSGVKRYSGPSLRTGQAGGFGFGGRAGVVREETARVIAELTGVPLPDAGARAALAAAAPQGGRTQDEDPDN